jgi:hypothetical protein
MTESSETNPTLESQAAKLITTVQNLARGVEASNEAIQESNQRIADSNRAIASLSRSGQRNRKLIVGLAVSMAFDIVLSIVLGFTAVSASNSSDKATVASANAQAAADANQKSATELCHTTNDSRAAAKAIWDHVISVVPASDAGTQKVLDDVAALVAKTYAPRKC